MLVQREAAVNIRSEIELKRKEMHLLSDQYGMTSDLVVKKSQELDQLLNQYGFRTLVNKR